MVEQNESELRNRLLKILAQKALFFGEFVLRSGQKSDHYFDCRRVTHHPEAAYLIGNLVFNKIQEIDKEIDGIAGMTLGADPICDAVCFVSHMKQHPIEALIVRKETKDHGAQRPVEGNIEEVSKIIVVDDVITTGGSTINAVEALQNFNHIKISGTIILVDREAGGAEALQSKGLNLFSFFTEREILSYAEKHGLGKK